MLTMRKMVKNIPGVMRLVHAIRDDKPFITRRIRRSLAGRPNALFVQVGSNDGLHGDPIRPIIYNDDRFSGIFIEPLKPAFERLKANYNNDPRFAFVNAAVGEDAPYKEFFYVSEDAKHAVKDLPEWWDQLGSFDKDHILKHLGGALAPFVVTDRIACRKLDDIIRSHGVAKLDLVHIDTEGYDYHVLCALDLSHYRPTVILYETKHLSAEARSAAEAMLKSTGYRVYNYIDDTLAVHPSW
jgi:FkbM family methyltransferase